jgi:hypothetical protein
MLTGDKQTITEIYPRIRKYLREVWEVDNSGMITPRKGGWYWGDWGINIDKPALQQCWYAVALHGFAEMARLTGHNRDAMWAEQMLDKMHYEFDKIFWDEKSQQYKSKEYSDAPDDRVQAMAVLAGLVPKTKYPIIRKFLATHYNASPYMEKYVLEALCRMGYYEDALIRLEKRFGEMVASEHSTLWEGWEYTGGRGMQYKSGNGTYNHAWSGGGLTILSEFIAGISPLKPAFEQFRVCPNLAMLNQVKSVVPTMFGNIVLKAKKCEKGLEMELVVPEKTTAVVELPQGYVQMEYSGKTDENLSLGAGHHKIMVR